MIVLCRMRSRVVPAAVLAVRRAVAPESPGPSEAAGVAGGTQALLKSLLQVSHSGVFKSIEMGWHWLKGVQCTEHFDEGCKIVMCCVQGLLIVWIFPSSVCWVCSSLSCFLELLFLQLHPRSMFSSVSKLIFRSSFKLSGEAGGDSEGGGVCPAHHHHHGWRCSPPEEENKDEGARVWASCCLLGGSANDQLLWNLS